MSDKIDDGGPAFAHSGNDSCPRQQGMTLRDWFAWQALAGWTETHHSQAFAMYKTREYGPQGMAMVAYQIADAMLAARKAGAR